MAANALKVYNEFRKRLITILPVQDSLFNADLVTQNLFHGDLREEVMNATTRAKAATLFLSEAIKDPLDTGDVEPFKKLLNMMENSDFQTLNKLAEKINEKLNESELLQLPPG